MIRTMMILNMSSVHSLRIKLLLMLEVNLFQITYSVELNDVQLLMTTPHDDAHLN